MKTKRKAIIRLFLKYLTLILFMILLGIHFCNQISIYAGKKENNAQKNFKELFPQEKRTINDFSYYKQNNQLTKQDIIIALNGILKEIKKESNTQIESKDFEIASEQLEEKYEAQAENPEEKQWQGSFQIEDMLGNKIEFHFIKKMINLDEIIENNDLGTIQITPNITDEQKKQLICEAIWQKNPQLQNKFLPKDFQFNKNKDGSNNFCIIESGFANEDKYHEYEGEIELKINYQKITNAAVTIKNTIKNYIIFYTITIITAVLIFVFLLILIYKSKHSKKK